MQSKFRKFPEGLNLRSLRFLIPLLLCTAPFNVTAAQAAAFGIRRSLGVVAGFRF